MEALINQEAFNALPKDLQEVVKTACLETNADMLAEYTQRNSMALKVLVEEHGVQLKRLPQEVLDHLEVISKQVVAELGEKDDLTKRIYQSYIDFKAKADAWKVIGNSL